MELQVLNNISAKIEWDSDAAKSAITSLVAPYRDLVVTDGNVKDMEKTQKELASMRRKIDSFRKDTKKTAEAPIKAFEMQVYDILKVIDEAESPLKDQLHKYEVERVNAASKEIMEQAREEAERQGLREKYMFDFTIDSSWTNRTVKKTFLIQSIESKISELKKVQDLDDEKERMNKLKAQQFELFCSNYSEKYGLNTPVTPQQVLYKVRDAELTDIPEIIENAVKQQADVERNMMAIMAQQEEAKQEKPETCETKIEVEESALCCVTISLKHVTKEQINMLETHKKIGGMEYEIVSYCKE